MLEVNNGDVDKSFESFITIVNSIIAEHAPLKKISVKERKPRAKPWITKGILTSINNKNKTYRKYCWAKNQTRRDELHNFCNIPKEIEKKLIPATTNYSCYLMDPAKNSLFMRPTDEKEIEQKNKSNER